MTQEGQGNKENKTGGKVKLVSVEDIIARPPQSRVPIPKNFEDLVRSVVPAPPGNAVQQIVGEKRRAVGGSRLVSASRFVHSLEDTSPNAKLTSKAPLSDMREENTIAAGAVQDEKEAMLAPTASNLPKLHAKKLEEVLAAQPEKPAQSSPAPNEPQPLYKATKPDMEIFGQKDAIADRVPEKLTTSLRVLSSKIPKSLFLAPQALEIKAAAMTPPITNGSQQGSSQKQVSGTQGSERNLIWHEESQQWIQSSYLDEQSGQ